MIYVIIGVVWTLLIDWMLRNPQLQSDYKLTTSQHIISIIIWPVTLCLFIGGFIQGAIHFNRKP